MRKKILVILLAVLVLFTSCDLMRDNSPKPKMYLIACGLSYKDSPWNALGNPIHDTTAIVGQFEELCKAAGYEYEIIWYSDDVTVNDSSPDSAARFTFTHIVNGLKKTPEKLGIYNLIQTDKFTNAFFEKISFDTAPTDNDCLLFYFSGHGYSSIEGKKVGGPILHYGGSGVTKFFNTISYDRLFKKLDTFKGRQVCIFDCCYSGASTDNPGMGHEIHSNELGTVDRFEEYYIIEEGFDGKEYISRDDKRLTFSLWSFIDSSMDSAFNHQAIGKPKRMCLNASTNTQLAMDFDDHKHDTNIHKFGAMTFRLLQALGYDTDNDRPAVPSSLSGEVVTVSKLYKAIDKGLSKQLKKTSTPNMTRSSYDMVIWDLR